MKKISSLIPYLAVFIIDFYILPLLITDTGSGMLMMLFIIPLIAFTASAVFGIKQGFSLLLPLAAAILFAPTVFIFYNESALIYVIAYSVITLLGNLAGRIFYK